MLKADVGRVLVDPNEVTCRQKAAGGLVWGDEPRALMGMQGV